MIDVQSASQSADAALEAQLSDGDPLLRPWGRPSCGTPQQVQNLDGMPSYWLVPLLAQGRTIGFVRVDAGGRTVAIGVLCRRPENISRCPDAVTGISAQEALVRARSLGALGKNETPEPPRYVHDGPPGREAWLVEVKRDGRPHRWIFVTRAGIYERPAGARIGETPGIE